MPASGDGFLRELAGLARQTVVGSLGRASVVAYINFPNHQNAGDPALWLGGRRLLRSAGIRIAYECEYRTYDPWELRRAVGETGTIVINGGGNLGDVYMNQQGVRERVLQDFPRARFLQLPQSIHFEHRRNLDRTADVIREMDFKLLVRERQSLAIARDKMGVAADLCPDLVFVLGAQRRPLPPRAPILWLAREDGERFHVGGFDGATDVERLDWLGPVDDEPDWTLLERAARRAERLLQPDAKPILRRTLPALTYPKLAVARFRRGLSILSRGRVIVTDRLHGHLFALLLGIPHVVLDNSTGKVSSTVETWTGANPLVNWADTPAEALARARSLVAEAT